MDAELTALLTHLRPIPWMTMWSYHVSKLYAWRAEMRCAWGVEDETCFQACLADIYDRASA